LTPSLRQRLFASCVLPFLLGGFGAPDAYASDLDTILERNHAAHGGDAYARIESIRVELLISEPSHKVQGTYLATREGLMRIDIHAGGERVFAEGISPECAWSWNPNRPAGDRGGCVGEARAATLRHGLELPGLFYTLKDVRDRGAGVQLIGPVGSETGPEWQLRLTLEDGFSRDYFIDQETYRITRARDFRASHPAVDSEEQLVETRFESPQWVEGVLRFERQVNVSVGTGETLGITTVLDLEFNPDVSAETFAAGWP
jgi:hypothetical protein